MARLSTKELVDLMKKTEHGCDHNCDDCPLWMTKAQMCYHEEHRLWQEWNKKEKERLGKVLE